METAQRARFLVGVASAAMVAAFVGTAALAQKTTDADTAAKFTGVWKLNHALSPGLAAAPAGGGAGGGRRGGTLTAPAFALAATPFQRGGGGVAGGAAGAPAPPSASDMAGRNVVASLKAVAETVTIKATADSITFTDPRGDRSYPVTDKDVKTEIGGTTLTTKSKWDKSSLKQQFNYQDSALTVSWDLNAAGDRLNYKMTTSDLSQSTARISEIKAVYDKQP